MQDHSNKGCCVEVCVFAQSAVKYAEERLEDAFAVAVAAGARN